MIWAKRLVQVLTILIVGAIATGYFYKSKSDHLTGDRIIGIAVLTLSFILIPLFIYSRYKKSKLGAYIFRKKTLEDGEETSKNQ